MRGSHSRPAGGEATATTVQHARTLWEEGRERGSRVVLLAVAVTATAAALDLLLTERISFFFDLCFVTACVAAALAVRPSDFFSVGVLAPLLMLGLFLLLALTRPGAIARPEDPAVQAVVSGLSHHSAALVSGYLLSLGVLAVRRRVQRARAEERAGGGAAPVDDLRTGPGRRHPA